MRHFWLMATWLSQKYQLWAGTREMLEGLQELSRNRQEFVECYFNKFTLKELSV